MKKIFIILLGILFITSCKTKQQTTKKVHTNTRKSVRKPIVKRKRIIKKTPKTTTYNKKILDKLYKNTTGLNLAAVSYIKKFSQLAINEMYIYKIPASITLAQGLLESGYGKSVLTTKSNNHFGIKCHKWEGKRVYHDDDAKGECFRKYDYAASSFRDHSLFLASKKRYAKLFTFDFHDYKSWAKGLKKAGYATDVNYPKKLIGIIEKYDLGTFDYLVVKKPGKFRKIKKEITDNKYHIVQVGETLYSISGQYYVSVDDIKSLNNLTGNTISVGQKLQLIKKLNKNNISNKYIVKQGDTLYTLSKKYGISVKNIKIKNGLSTNSLFVGQKLVIK